MLPPEIGILPALLSKTSGEGLHSDPVSVAAAQDNLPQAREGWMGPKRITKADTLSWTMALGTPRPDPGAAVPTLGSAPPPCYRSHPRLVCTRVNPGLMATPVPSHIQAVCLWGDACRLQSQTIEVVIPSRRVSFALCLSFSAEKGDGRAALKAELVRLCTESNRAARTVVIQRRHHKAGRWLSPQRREQSGMTFWRAGDCGCLMSFLTLSFLPDMYPENPVSVHQAEPGNSMAGSLEMLLAARGN